MQQEITEDFYHMVCLNRYTELLEFNVLFVIDQRKYGTRCLQYK